MIFEGKIDLDVPVAKTWDFLIDINKFSACLPGIEEVKQIDDKTFEGAVVAAKLGRSPESSHFVQRSLRVSRRNKWWCETEGTDSVTKSTVNADMTRGSAETAANDKTKWTIRADIKIKGRLAILGDMVLRATATLILQEFARRLRQRAGRPSQSL